MITVAPRVLMAGDLRRGSLKVIPTTAASPLRPAGLMLNPGRETSPSVRVLLDAVRATVSQLIAQNQSGITSIYGGVSQSDDLPGPS
jgi:LysR family pca operon transcriptional activator